jgi:hypothetical protein
MAVTPIIGSVITPVQVDAQAAMQAFIQSLLPSADVIAAQANRAAEPQTGSFVVMTPVTLERLSTNFEQYGDVRAVGSISGQAFTVTAVTIGSIALGNPLDGTGVTPGTYIAAQTSGPPGGAGTYTLNNSMTIPGPEAFSVGTWIMHAAYRMRMQLDFHSDDYTAYAWAQTVGIVLRSDNGVRFFADLPSPQNNVRPLYADEPAQRPFTNDQQQIEWRWVLDAHIQINQTVLVPQDYADKVHVGLIPVDIFYDP